MITMLVSMLTEEHAMYRKYYEPALHAAQEPSPQSSYDKFAFLFTAQNFIPNISTAELRQK
jgi:hypothetical protein